MTIIAAPTLSTLALTLLEEKSTSIAATSTPSPTLPSIDEVLESVPPTPENDEEMVDFENTSVKEGMDMNMVYYLPADLCVVDEEGEVV
jgi:hypothetical protein